MRTGLKIALLFVICLGLTHCGERSAPPTDSSLTGVTDDQSVQSREHLFWDANYLTGQQLVHAGNTFGFNLFKEIVKTQPDVNIFISPISVSMALGMTQNGAAGATLEAMLSTLGLSGYTLESANECYRELIDLLINLDPDVQFQIANSIWYHHGFILKDAFRQACADYFDAEVRGLDFWDPTAADTINAWVEDNTNGLIEDMVAKPLDPMLVVILLNAIYFKGFWTHEFDPSFTEPRWFYLPDGSRVPCNLMMQHESHFYTSFEAPKFYAVDLAYGDSLFSMTVFLPKEGIQVDAVVADLDQANWESWMDSFGPWFGILYMPRFEIEYELNMNQILTDLGMEVAFIPGLADFSEMFESTDIWISKVKHKTFVKVDESGTEAAAATEVEGPTSVPPIIALTRPFIFFIRESQTNTILFMGKVVDPGFD